MVNNLIRLAIDALANLLNQKIWGRSSNSTCTADSKTAVMATQTLHKSPTPSPPITNKKITHENPPKQIPQSTLTKIKELFWALFNAVNEFGCSIRHRLFPCEVKRWSTHICQQFSSSCSELCKCIFDNPSKQKTYEWQMTPTEGQIYPQIVGLSKTKGEKPSVFLCQESKEDYGWKKISLEDLLSISEYFLAGGAYLNKYGKPLIQEVPLKRAPRADAPSSQDPQPVVFQDIKAVYLEGESNPICFIYWGESEKHWKILPHLPNIQTDHETQCWDRLTTKLFESLVTTTQWQKTMQGYFEQAIELTTVATFLNIKAFESDLGRGFLFVCIDEKEYAYTVTSSKNTQDKMDFCRIIQAKLPEDSVYLVFSHAYQAAAFPISRMIACYEGIPSWAVNAHLDLGREAWPAQISLCCEPTNITIKKDSNSDLITTSYTTRQYFSPLGAIDKKPQLSPFFLTATYTINTKGLPTLKAQEQMDQPALATMLRKHVTVEFTHHTSDESPSGETG